VPFKLPLSGGFRRQLSLARFSADDLASLKPLERLLVPISAFGIHLSVGGTRLELVTSAMSTLRSSQLS
jgi:hypothetical protein